MLSITFPLLSIATEGVPYPAGARDPALAISDMIAANIRERFGAGHIVKVYRDENDVVSAPKGGHGVIVNVYTTTWKIEYLAPLGHTPTDNTPGIHYGYGHGAQVELLDADTQEVLMKFKCGYHAPVPGELAPTYDEVFENNDARLGQWGAGAAEQCFKRFTQLLGTA
jgi:hypothetical protein